MNSPRDHRKQLYERLVGQTIAGRFEITRLMGFGGMGAVYEAIQNNMNRRIALKFIPSHNPVTAARFEREALTVSQLRHPNTVTVFDYGQTDDGFLFLTMELLNGHTLSDLIKQGPIEPTRAVHIATQICRSLSEAHRHGIVHRDIKPDNIFLIELDGDKDFVKVLDFGIAKVISGEDDVQLTGDGRIIGTPRYMSPEQILSSAIDPRSDIYSLGCIIFEMLCGAPPFQQSTTTALMISHTQDPPPAFAERLNENSLDRIPLGLEHVVRRALAKNADERPQTTDQLREELEQALQRRQDMLADNNLFNHTGTSNRAALNRSSTTLGQVYQEEATKKSPSSALFIMLGLLVIVCAIAAVGVVYYQSNNNSQPALETNSNTLLQNDSLKEQQQLAAIVPEKNNPVRIRVSSEPAGATVLEGSDRLGKTPLTVALPPDTTTVVYRLELEGYEVRNVDISLNPGVNTRQEFSFALLPETVKPEPQKATTTPAKTPRSSTKAQAKSNPEPKPAESGKNSTTSNTTNPPAKSTQKDTGIVIERLDDGESTKPKVDRL